MFHSVRKVHAQLQKNTHNLSSIHLHFSRRLAASCDRSWPKKTGSIFNVLAKQNATMHLERALHES